MKIEKLVMYIIKYCIDNNLNKIYICGNGGSGKTTLSKYLKKESSKYGKVNIISTDDFLVDTKLRKNSTIKWEDNNTLYSHRYTSSNIESYFLKNIYEIIYNIDNGVDCYYFPRRYKEKNNIRKLYSNYFLTIIEGVATAFLDKDKNSLSILLKCDKQNEIKRRKERTEKLNRDITELYDEKRTSQYKTNVLKYENQYDLIITNDNEFNYKIINKDI